MGSAAAIAHRHEVGPTAELASSTCQHDNTVGRVVLDLRERFQQFDPHLSVHRILALRPIEGDRDDTVAPVDRNGFE